MSPTSKVQLSEVSDETILKNLELCAQCIAEYLALRKAHKTELTTTEAEAIAEVFARFAVKVSEASEASAQAKEPAEVKE